MIVDADKCLYFDYIYKQSLSLLYDTSCTEINEDLEQRLFNHLIIQDIDDCNNISDRYLCLNYYNITEINRIYNSCSRPSIKCPSGNSSVVSSCDIIITDITNTVSCTPINITQI